MWESRPADACVVPLPRFVLLQLTLRSWIHSEENKRRTLQRSDIATAIAHTEVYDFLIVRGPTWRDTQRGGLGPLACLHEKGVCQAREADCVLVYASPHLRPCAQDIVPQLPEGEGKDDEGVAGPSS